MFNLTSLRAYLADRDRGRILLLLAAVCVVYLPFLGNPFMFDDGSIISPAALDVYAGKPSLSLRWLPYASLAWTNAVVSAEFAHLYHLGNMLLHFANTILLFYLLRGLLGAVHTEPDSAGSARGAWFGALIFALHPVAVYAVGYVVQRSILMATMFALIMQLAYLRGLMSGQKRWFLLSVLAYFLACFSKEHSVLMPAVLMALSVLVRGKNRAQPHVLWLTWLAFFAIAVLVTLLSKGVFGSPYEVMATQLFVQQGVDASTPMLHLLSALTQAGLFFKYLLLWLFPDTALMSVDMRVSFIASAFAWQAWLGGLAFMLYGVLGMRLLLRGGISGLAGFALLYPWLQFWVEMVGIRVQEPFVLYRSYLWMPGMMLLLPLLLARLPQRKALAVIVCAAILLIPLSWGRLWVFADDYRLWNEAASLLESDKVAGADRIFYNRGLAEMAEKRWQDAALDFKRSSNLSPRLGPVRYNLGLAYSNSGRYEEALAQYDIAASLTPKEGAIYFSKAVALKAIGRDAEALQQLRLSCELNNQVACLYVGGVTYLSKNPPINK